MATDSLPDIRVSPPSIINTQTEETHAHQRVFIGPMPEHVVSSFSRATAPQDELLFVNGVEGSRRTLRGILRRHAHQYFIDHGGDPDNWGTEEEKNVLDEMVKVWRTSVWGRFREQQAVSASHSRKWIGGSFEVGQLLGVNLQKITNNGPVTFNIPSSSHLPQTYSDTPLDGNASNSTFGSVDSSASSGVSPSHGDMGALASTSATTTTALLASSAVPARTVSAPNANLKTSSGSLRHDALLGKGKGRSLSEPFGATKRPQTPPPIQSSEATGSTHSTESVRDQGSADRPSTEDVVMRDRMLVRVAYSKHEPIGTNFDEEQHRTTRNLHHEDWAEFMVVWRKDRLELYKDYKTPGKEWVVGHKHLSFVVPLDPKTNLSLYSFVDLTFCLLYPGSPGRSSSSRSLFPLLREKTGTSIYLFKVKTRSRGQDWMWRLWHRLGGKLPKTVDIRNPFLGARIQVEAGEIPEFDCDALRVFTRENLKDLFLTSLRSLGNYDALLEQQLEAGKALELAWRVDTYLDWIWLDEDIQGIQRAWLVLCGFACKQFNPPPALEIRLAEHTPAHVHLTNGRRLQEPPAVEGYLERIKPGTHLKQASYLVTHEGYLFTVNPSHANPPAPPDLISFDNSPESLRHKEVKRGATQLMGASGVCDLGNILAIRRAFHLVPHESHTETPAPESEDLWFGIWSQSEDRTQSDDEDEGGEEGLSRQNDKPRWRMTRSFELLLRSGHVIRFEAYSRRVALEWIERLRALVVYWKERHRIDAREAMDLAQAHRRRLTPHTRAHQNEEDSPPEEPVDMGGVLPALGSLYSWCTILGCKPIIRGGTAYMRRGMRGQYKLVHLFLVPGHLVPFRVKPGNLLHKAMRKRTSLLDAYVCSGYYAASVLPPGEYNANAGPTPRKYQDGLEADDPEEDTIFMLWYRSQPPGVQAEEQSTPTSPPPPPPTIPDLSAKNKYLTFRTRSKLERDSWCWSLNCEIEKLSRLQRDRETKLREMGALRRP